MFPDSVDPPLADDDVPEASLRAKRAVAETARHVAPHWPKLHKAEKRCRMQAILSKTHYLVYNFDWVWEQWRLM